MPLVTNSIFPPQTAVTEYSQQGFQSVLPGQYTLDTSDSITDRVKHTAAVTARNVARRPFIQDVLDLSPSHQHLPESVAAKTTALLGMTSGLLTARAGQHFLSSLQIPLGLVRRNKALIDKGNTGLVKLIFNGVPAWFLNGLTKDNYRQWSTLNS